MNIVLKKLRPVEYYIACVKKNGSFMVHGKYITKEGKIREQSKSGPFDTYEEGIIRCRSLAKMKIRKKGFYEVELADIPEKVCVHMEVPPDMQITPAEMLAVMRGAKAERYVVFKNVLGLEESFDLGVEYLATVTEEDGVLSVYDRFGETRQCFEERMESIVPTEDAKKAEGIKKL
jgi:hypothetical protein